MVFIRGQQIEKIRECKRPTNRNISKNEIFMYFLMLAILGTQRLQNKMCIILYCCLL